MVPVAAPGDEDVARILARVLREAKKDWAEFETAVAPRDVKDTVRFTLTTAVAPQVRPPRLATADVCPTSITRTHRGQLHLPIG